MFAVENARHVPAERLYERDHDRAVEQDLDPADDCHCRAFWRCSGRGLEGVPISGVMAGLVPAIHVLLAELRQERRGGPRQARAWRWHGDSISPERTPRTAQVAAGRR